LCIAARKVGYNLVNNELDFQGVFWEFSASIHVGNVLPLSSMPEGTVVCNVEHKTGDGGSLARCSGNYATVISHNPDSKISRVKLPSGVKKVINWNNRAMIGEFFVDYFFVFSLRNSLFIQVSQREVDVLISPF
jgi:ribosomal protein L2